MVGNFGYNAGGWRVDRHPRLLGDTTGDGRKDIVGFGNAGVYVSRQLADGSFEAPGLVITNFGFGLMIFFILFVTLMSIGQYLLKRRKQR